LTSKLEQEVKLSVPDLMDALRRVEALDGVVVARERHFEDNVLYDRKGELYGRGEILRLRRTPHGARVTFKGPHPGGEGVKTREEIEFDADADAADLLFVRLGFERRFRYQKYRRAFRWRDVEIVVDETPIGCYLEVEGPPAGIDAAVSALGFGAADRLTLSYLELHTQSGGSGDLVFDQDRHGR
jgi:adenylate cyclase class 2